MGKLIIRAKIKAKTMALKKEKMAPDTGFMTRHLLEYIQDWLK